jgi:tetratricopeptide (TPR) repeat protein
MDRMKCALRSLSAFAFGLFLAASLHAAEPAFEFLEVLRNDRQGALAIQYLNNLKAAGRASPELLEVFDLEMARSLQVAADETVNEDEAAKFRLDAQAALDAFLKTQADHSEAAFAFDTYGNLSMDRGNQLSRQANLAKDAKKKETLLAEARKEYTAAKPRFVEAEKRFKVRLDEADAEVKAAVDQSKEKKGNAKFRRAANSADEQRNIVENDWLNCRFKAAMLDYYLAETYSDPKNPEAVKSYKAASDLLDKIFQGYREARPGVLAHFWHGMAAKQLGDKLTAEDIFDEVVARTPPPNSQRDGTALAFFAEAERQKLLLLADKQRFDDVIDEGTSYLKFQRMRTDPYFGIAVEIAKAHIAKGVKQAGPERKKTIAEAVSVLRDATKQTSMYHREATALLNKYAAEIGQESMANTFDEAISTADIAFQSGDPKGAIEGYLKALEMSKKEKVDDKLKERVEAVRYQLASARYSSQDYAGAYADALKLAQENKDAKLAPPAAVLAMNSALAMFGTTQDKAAAQAQLQTVVNYTVQTWPKRAEADDARIALGRLKLFQADIEGAIATFEAVNPASDRYPQALQLAGQSHWKLYGDAKRAGKADEAKKHRDQAETQLNTALAAFQQNSALATQMAQSATETPLLLAEMSLEAADAEKALTLLEPLIEKLQSQPPESLDLTGMRILVSAIRAQSTLKKPAEATQLAMILIDKGQDIAPVNAILGSVSQTLRSDFKAKQVEADAAGEENAGAKAAATQSKQLLVDFLKKLTSRKNLSLQEKIVLGDTAGDVGESALARALYQQAVEAAEAGAGNPKLAGAMVQVKSRLIGLLRSEEKFDEAIQLADALIKEQPRALDPKVERARIITSQALTQSDAVKWTEATNAWAQLRTMMQGMQKKPAEYYESVYETARGLGEQAKLSTSQQKSKEMKSQGRQLLKGTMALTPNLSGPDMVAKYQALTTELEE